MVEKIYLHTVATMEQIYHRGMKNLIDTGKLYSTRMKDSVECPREQMCNDTDSFSVL